VESGKSSFSPALKPQSSSVQTSVQPGVNISELIKGLVPSLRDVLVPIVKETVRAEIKQFVDDRARADKFRSVSPSTLERARQIRCHLCKELGHFMRDCPKSTRDRSKSPIPSSPGGSPRKPSLNC
jgi:hypothetical protein